MRRTPNVRQKTWRNGVRGDDGIDCGSFIGQIKGNMMIFIWPVFALLLITLACNPQEKAATEPAAGWAGTIDTLESGALLVRNPAEGLWEEAPRLVERLRIGTLDGPNAFGRVGAIEVDVGRRVYVSDKHTAEVQVFDSLGRYIRSLGGKGRGPGELLDPVGLTWQNDSTIWIVDYGNARYSVYDTSGAHLEDRRRDALGSLWPWPGRFSGGRLIEPRVKTGAYRLVAVDGNAPAEPADTFPYAITGLPPRYWEPSFYLRTDRAVRRVAVPFAAGYKWALDDERNVWGGDTRRYLVSRRSLEGDTSLLITRDVPQIPVSAAEREAAISSLAGTLGPSDLDQIPRDKPFFRAVIPSTDGGVWLLREGVGDDWLVDLFGPDGRFLATLEADVGLPDLSVLPVLDHSSLWLVVLDSLDVQNVVLLKALARPQ